MTHNGYHTINNYNEYTENDDTELYFKNYIQHIALWEPTVDYNNTNHIYVDLYIYYYVNYHYFDKLEYNKEHVLEHFDTFGYNGNIYCVRQIKNILNNHSLKILQKDDELYITHQDKIYNLRDYVKKYIYSCTYDNFIKNTVTQICKNFCDPVKNVDTLYVIFIGSAHLGIKLIQKLLKNNKHLNENTNYVFIIKKLIKSFDIICLIKKNFRNYSIYAVNEYGSDIIPSMIVYDLVKNNKYNHVIKLHTKNSNITQFNEMIDYLLSTDISHLHLIYNLDKISNCIGEPTYRHMIVHEKLNKNIMNTFKHIVDDTKTHFCIGSMFYTKPIVMNKILEHIKDNYKMYLYNNMYDNNTFFYSNSPVHFLERLFGNIKT